MDSNRVMPYVGATTPSARGDDEGADEDDKIEQGEWQDCCNEFEEDSHLDVEVLESGGYIEGKGEGDGNAEGRYAD